MRIQTLAAATVLATAAMLPLATGALADETTTCTQMRAEANEVIDAQIDHAACAEARNHPTGRAHHEKDRPEPRCTDSVRDRLRHLDPDQLRDRLRDGGWPKDWPEDWKRAWTDCYGDSDPERDRPEHDGDKNDSDKNDSDKNDSDKNDSDTDDGDADGGRDSDSADSDDDDDDDGGSTQVKIVPKGSVDTGDGSAR